MWRPQVSSSARSSFGTALTNTNTIFAVKSKDWLEMANPNFAGFIWLSWIRLTISVGKGLVGSVSGYKWGNE